MRNRGGALIEVLVALVILASAGVSTIGFLTAFLDSAARAETRERVFEGAERVLTATVLLNSEELDLRIGAREQGRVVVWTSRPEPGLYRIAVADTAVPDQELLVTVVYRPGADPEAPHVP